MYTTFQLTTEELNNDFLSGVKNCLKVVESHLQSTMNLAMSL